MKHRHVVSGGEAAVAEASLNCDQIWERLVELIDKINKERYFTPVLQDIPSTNITISAGVIAAHTSNTISNNTTTTTTSTLPINLYQPPHSIFMEAVHRLCRQGFILTNTSWRLINNEDGPRSVLYKVHESFSHSDLVAALKTKDPNNVDPMHKYIL